MHPPKHVWSQVQTLAEVELAHVSRVGGMLNVALALRAGADGRPAPTRRRRRPPRRRLLVSAMGVASLGLALYSMLSAAAASHRAAMSARPAAAVATAPGASDAVGWGPAAGPATRRVPFVILFESSSGSSWLTTELAAHPRLCVVLFEPIDNISLADGAAHAARIAWLRALWDAPVGVADEGEWGAWRQRVLDASVFGQLPLIRSSLSRCGASSVGFGLKARLSRLFSHPPSIASLAETMAARRVRVVRLTRHNVIKQALAEYRRLHAGLGQFAASKGVARRDGDGGNGGGSAVTSRRTRVRLAPFRDCLVGVERSHRLTDRVVAALAYLRDRRSRQEAPGGEGGASASLLLNVSYEDLLSSHDATIASVVAFLTAQPSPRAAGAARGAGGGGYVKATPDRLCKAVENYEQLCGAFATRAARGGAAAAARRRTTAAARGGGEAGKGYDSYFELPCDTECV